MKIAILGPITTKNYYGGVAIFDEELALGFRHNNRDTILLTNQKDAEKERKGIPVRVVNYFNAHKIIKEENPDVLLASLQYAKYWKFCDRKMTKIYFLHGFFNQSYYGKLKAEVAALYQKSITRNCQHVFANSYFTKMINNQFFGIRADHIFHLGVTSQFYNEIHEADLSKEKNTILYAGRLVSAKGVGKLLESLKILKVCQKPHKAYIVGDGPDEKKLRTFVKENDLDVCFLGRLSQEKLVEYYAKSEFFISLNPSEPFGIVFLEAILANCKIVCPCTGGQTEYLMGYRERVAFVDESSPYAVAEGIEQLEKNPTVECYDDDMMLSFNYNTVAKQMISCMGEYENGI